MPSSEVGQERIEFFPGQSLRAADLRQLDKFHRGMRQVHNKSLHQPGIGSGFEVAGERGDREVRIGRGYAIDSAGHEIVLLDERVEAVPPVARGRDGESVYFDLIVGYLEDAEEAERRRGVCATQGVVRLREEPSIQWVRLQKDSSGSPSHIAPGQGGQLGVKLAEGRLLRLARVEVEDCRLKSLSLEQRRSANPTARVNVHSGTSPLVLDPKSSDLKKGVNLILGLIGTCEFDLGSSPFCLAHLSCSIDDQSGDKTLVVVSTRVMGRVGRDHPFKPTQLDGQVVYQVGLCVYASRATKAWHKLAEKLTINWLAIEEGGNGRV